MVRQEIIVYRNPAEAALWDSIMNGNLFFAMGAVALLAAVWCVVYLNVQKFNKKLAQPLAWVTTIGAAVLLHLLNVKYL